MEKNNPRITWAWSSYDLANSVYSLSVSTAIFPVYYANVVKDSFEGGIVDFFGRSIAGTTLYSWSLSFSFLLIAFISPFLSGMADYSGNKKVFMKFFTYLGSASCAGMFFFTGPNVEWGLFCTVLASIGFSGSLVFYNSYLPDIATPDKFDRLSAQGFILGYAGSVFLLLMNLGMILFPNVLGFADSGSATRFSFLTVGVWWFGFSQIAFRNLPRHTKAWIPKGQHWFAKGYADLKSVVRQSSSVKGIRLFLASFFSYILGVITIIYLATLFASEELKMSSQSLIVVILILQLVAIFGAWGFSYLSGRIGNRFALQVMIVIWFLVCLTAFFIQTELQFFFLSMVVGLVLGGIQSISRSAYAKLIPTDTTQTASFFSFYDVTEKLATVAGTFTFGLIFFLTESMRWSALALGFFFLLGFIGLIFVRFPLTNK